MTTDQQRILEELGHVHDPCCQEKGISVVDMGLVHSVAVDGAHAQIGLLLTTGWCPFATRVVDDVRERVEGLAGIEDVRVEILWTEPWTTDRLSESARRKLRFLPDPLDVPDRVAYIAAHKAVPSGSPPEPAHQPEHAGQPAVRGVLP